MKKLIIFAAILLAQTSFGALTEPDRALVEKYRELLTNPGFESGGKAGWTASGGATATANSTAKGTGNLGYDFDSNSAGQTLVSSAITIPAGFKGKNGLFSCAIKTVSGTATHTITVYDGTNNIVSPVTINSNTNTFVTTSSNFIFPSSGTVAIKITSVSSNEPEIYVDDCSVRLADNVGMVGQAVLFGLVKITGCAGSFQKVAAGATLVAYTAQTGCSYATEGNAVADTAFGSTQLPAIKFSTMPAGEYKIEYEGTIGPNGTSGTIQSNQFTDGTTTAREISHITEGPNATGQTSGISQSFVYTAAKANVTWQLFSAVSDGNNTQVFGTTAKPGVIRVYYFPPSSSQVVNPNVTPASWSGYHASDCAWSTTSTSFVDPSADATCTFTETTNRNFGTVSSAGAKTPGIVFTPQKPGMFFICATTKLTNSVNGSSSALKLWDGTIQIAQADARDAGAYGATVPVCGVYNATSVATKTISLQIKASGNTASIGAILADVSIGWSVVALDSSFPAPILTGSVTSNTSGSERIERATFTNTGSCAVSSQSGSWITSVGDPGTGQCTINYASTTWSTAPTCVCTDLAGNKPCSISVAPTTTSVVTQTNIINTNATGFDAAFGVICMGPR